MFPCCKKPGDGDPPKPPEFGKNCVHNIGDCNEPGAKNFKTVKITLQADECEGEPWGAGVDYNAPMKSMGFGGQFGNDETGGYCTTNSANANIIDACNQTVKRLDNIKFSAVDLEFILGFDEAFEATAEDGKTAWSIFTPRPALNGESDDGLASLETPGYGFYHAASNVSMASETLGATKSFNRYNRESLGCIRVFKAEFEQRRATIDTCGGKFCHAAFTEKRGASVWITVDNTLSIYIDEWWRVMDRRNPPLTNMNRQHKRAFWRGQNYRGGFMQCCPNKRKASGDVLVDGDCTGPKEAIQTSNWIPPDNVLEVGEEYDFTYFLSGRIWPEFDFGPGKRVGTIPTASIEFDS